MRNNWKEDPKYIVNLTKQLIGQDALQFIIDENKEDCDPCRVRSYVAAILMNKIKIMNESTLGRICSYASSDGAHGGLHPQGTPRPEFINRTGLTKALKPVIDYMFTHLGVGEYLEQGVLTVIVCIVVDIILQDKWQAEWDNHEMTEDEEKTSRARGV